VGQCEKKLERLASRPQELKATSQETKTKCEEVVEYGCKNILINYENMLSGGLISAVINVQLISVRIGD
jgi:hypothetical protein